MRRLCLALTATLVLSAVASAQQQDLELPEIVIGGKPSAKAPKNCADKQAGDSRFNCLNKQMRQQVDRTAPTLNLPPVDVRSPDVHLGIVSVPALRQQYGQNYGVSVIPYRPTRQY